MTAWFALDERVVEAGLNNPANARHGVIVSDEVFDDGVECFVEVLWDGEMEPVWMCLGHMNPEPDEPCDCCQRGPCVCEDGGCEHCGPEPFEDDVVDCEPEDGDGSTPIDRIRGPIATRWSDVGEFGDSLLDGDKDAWDDFHGFSAEARERFWQSYHELGSEPLGPTLETRERPVAQRVVSKVLIRSVDDEHSEVVRRDVVEFPAGTFAEALDAEWAARVPLVGGAGGAGSIGEDSASAELNRLVDADERLARASRRAEEALVVVDRRAVTVVPPRVMRSGEWDVERGERVAEPVAAENRRHWHESREEAQRHAEAIVAKLKARGVPCRTWTPDNRSEREKMVDAFRYWKAQRRQEVTV
jgi:hypothetical protein